jgi:hypothetical protein
MSVHANPSVGSDAQALRKRNVRLGLILASVVAVFFVGFVVKIVLLSQH